MLQPAAPFLPLTGVDYDRTLVVAIELSSKNWVLAAQVPGLLQTKARRTIEPTKEALFEALHGYHARAVAAGRQVERVVAIYEAGWSGFWAELVCERVALVNRVNAVLATLGADDYNPLRQSRRRRLDELRTGLGEPLPPNARAKIERLLARLELVLTQIAELERERDAVVKADVPDHAALMIQQLICLRGIGVQSATVLVREAFVRRFTNGKALGAYAGLTATPFNSGGIEREQGIGKAGNRRLRSVMVELAWIWQRYQPSAAPVIWFRQRVGTMGRRVRKVMVVPTHRPQHSQSRPLKWLPAPKTIRAWCRLTRLPRVRIDWTANAAMSAVIPTPTQASSAVTS